MTWYILALIVVVFVLILKYKYNVFNAHIGSDVAEHEVSTGKKLLCHIAYYDSNERVDNKHGIDKGSREWKEHVFNGVKKTVETIQNYTAFETVDIIIDANVENSWVNELEGVRVVKHDFSHEHPFFLTTKHRENVKNNIDNYDYFMYIEDDTYIPNATMNHIVSLTPGAWRAGNVLALTRMVTPLNVDGNEEIYYSDIRNKFIKSNLPKLNAVVPMSKFSASWVYDKAIVKEWVKHHSFMDFSGPLKDGGIRVDMGIGFKEKEAIVPVDSNKKPKTICFHLGYCGKYYFRHPDGFHTLPL